MISHEHRCIFIHITKTGGTSLEKFFLGEDMEILDVNAKHLSAVQAREAYREYWDDYFKFSFVRNPWDKILSHYFFRCVDKAQRGFDPSRAGLTLYQFISLSRGNPLICSQQLDMIADKSGKILVDYVARYENFQDEFMNICRLLGIAHGGLVHANKTNHDHYSSCYDEDSKDLVAVLFADDIKRFGYSF